MGSIYIVKTDDYEIFCFSTHEKAVEFAKQYLRDELKYHTYIIPVTYEEWEEQLLGNDEVEDILCIEKYRVDEGYGF